jgi:hypothetical protein
MAIIRGVLAHGGHPEAVVESLAAERDGLEEFWDVLWAEFGRLVVVGRRAG